MKFVIDGKIVEEIKNANGEILFSYKRTFLNLDELDLSGAQLASAVAQGLCCMDTNFSKADLRGVDFYWITAFGANFEEANLEGAQLQGGNLVDVSFKNANLNNTNLGCDNLQGSTQLQGADLSGASVINTIFEGAEYNDATIFPKNFDPIKHGMIKK